MPDKTISIPQPVLKMGETFSVRYRMLPSGSWVDITPKTNTPFTITGLSVGNYTLEVAIIRGGVPCDKKHYSFSVEDPCDCPPSLAYTAVFDVYGNIHLHITTGTPSAKITGYRVDIRDGNGAQSVLVNPSSVQNYTIVFPETIGAYNMIIFAICGKYEKVCFDSWIAIDPAPCTGISGYSATITKMITAIGTIQYYLRILLTQSNPATLNTTVSYNQTDKVVMGSQDGGTSFVNQVNPIIMIPIYPNINVVSSDFVNYNWRFSDICGNIISGTATGLI